MKIVTSIGQEVNFVLQVVDDHNKEPPKGRIRYVEVTDKSNEVKLNPLIKQTGYVIFTNLLSGAHDIRIESDYYLPYNLSVDEAFDPLTDLESCRLKPTASYPFNNRTTVAYFRLMSEDGRPYCGNLCAYIVDETQYVARVMEVMGDTYRIAKVKDTLMVGDEFILSEEGQRRLRIEKILEDDVFDITMISGPAPMVGDKLYKALFTHSEQDGRGVIYFTGLHQATVNVNIVIDGVASTKEVQVTLSESAKLNLGDIVT